MDKYVAVVSNDPELSELLNVNVYPTDCICISQEFLVIVTTKIYYYHEPVKHIPHLRLVVLEDGSYYIQVMF